VQTDYAGVLERTCSSLPYGDQESCAATPTEHLFTGKERDAESGNDYFGARYYASSMGRFMSPDPSALDYADPTNPQSLNLYAYAMNNPLIYLDPTGLECVWSDGSYDSNDDKDTGDNAGTNGDHSGCTGQGGAWVDHSFFASQNAADWSSSGNTDLAGVYTALTSSSTSITVNADTSGSMMSTDVGYDSSVGVYFTKNDQSWGIQDPSLGLAIGVMSQGIPKLCGIGVTANLGKLKAGASASGNGVGGNVNGHSAGTETPQNTGSGKVTVPIGGPNGTVPFNVHYNGSGPLRGVTSVDAGGTVKTRFGKVGVNGYVNVGTYTPNISDPQNCPD
jgi:RHS repeat-associated protein